MGRSKGPKTKTVTVVLAKPVYLRIAALAVQAEMPPSSYLRTFIEARFPEPVVPELAQVAEAVN
jgi:hypothetical protein